MMMVCKPLGRDVILIQDKGGKNPKKKEDTLWKKQEWELNEELREAMTGIGGRIYFGWTNLSEKKK